MSLFYTAATGSVNSSKFWCRSQLDYESFMKNYDMNIKFQLRKFGLLPSLPSRTLLFHFRQFDDL
jgi:hypothetical protein